VLGSIDHAGGVRLSSVCLHAGRGETVVRKSDSERVPQRAPPAARVALRRVLGKEGVVWVGHEWVGVGVGAGAGAGAVCRFWVAGLWSNYGKLWDKGEELRRSAKRGAASRPGRLRPTHAARGFALTVSCNVV
jgi:hypothetical protein